MQIIDCFYNNDERQMIGGFANKVEYFLKKGLVREAGQNIFAVFPAPGRKKIQIVDLNENSCSCQYFQMKKGNCSHIVACIRYIKKNIQ
jgi:hypothetical protein